MKENNEIKKILEDLGLSDAEIKIYLTALELGAQPASVIAKKSGFKRGHTYNLLNLLIEKGVIQEFLKNKVKHYTSSTPKRLVTILEHKEDKIAEQKQRLMRVVPFLEKIRNPHLAGPKIRFFQGIEGIKEIYEDTIRLVNQPIYAIADFDCIFPKKLNKELHDWIWDYADRRAKKNVRYYGIANKSKLSDQAFKKRLKQKRELKGLSGVHLPVEINIYGNKVAVMSTFKDIIGLIIEDAPTAETLRNFHKAIWDFLPDYSA